MGRSFTPLRSTQLMISQMISSGWLLQALRKHAERIVTHSIKYSTQSLFEMINKFRSKNVGRRIVDRKSFMNYIKLDDSDCWNWAGAIHKPSGYAMAYFKSKLWKAHRLSYTLHVGPIPDGLLVCHTCDNRGCVNPNHLFLGTHKDNCDDMYRKGRNVKPYTYIKRPKRNY